MGWYDQNSEVLNMAEAIKIGFLGAGNMAKALIKGILESGIHPKEQLVASDKEGAALEAVFEQFGIKCLTDNRELVKDCPLVVLAVKPQQIPAVIEEIKGVVRDDQLIISIAAGIPLAMIQALMGKEIPIIRVMPNTPALVQRGISAMAGNHKAGPEHMERARTIFGAVGQTVDVAEDMMDAVTALSGSGPGYVFRIMECMVNAGISVGLEKDIAERLVIQTFLGAAYLAGESDHPLSRLREMVTSPGGTTAAGLAVFENTALESTIIQAVQAACNRSVELGKKTS